jgi:hypothetical protein
VKLLGGGLFSFSALKPLAFVRYKEYLETEMQFHLLFFAAASQLQSIPYQKPILCARHLTKGESISAFQAKKTESHHLVSYFLPY